MTMIAVPVENGKLCAHFGHCSSFAIFELSSDGKSIASRRDIPAPPHEPGLLPSWLSDQGTTVVICGGMGSRALELFMQKDIDVVTGAPLDRPEALVAAYLQGTMQIDVNICDHGKTSR